MQLECKIRRNGGTETTMPNPDGSRTTYRFLPVDPTRADSPHVANVVDQAHYDRFLFVAPECYVPFGGKAPKVDLPKPVTVREAVTVDAVTAAAMATAPSALQAEAVADKASDDDADTNNDGRLSVAELSAGIAAGKFTPEELRELLAAEEESGDPRKGFVKVITKALK